MTRAKEERQHQADRVRKYQPATTRIARELAEQARGVLEDVVGAATVQIDDVDPDQPSWPGERAGTTVRVTAKSKLSPESLELYFNVSAVMDGSEQYDELRYSLTGTIDYRGGKRRVIPIDLPIKQSGVQRPTFADNFAEQIRELIGLV